MSNSTMLDDIKDEISHQGTVRVAINGFGRIGRMIFRAGYDDPQVEFVVINDLGGPEAAQYYLTYDSAHGTFPYEVIAEEDALVVGEKRIPIVQEKDIHQLPWSDYGVDVVAECTGVFTDEEQAKVHLERGAKKVVISAPGKGDVFYMVRGVNDDAYNPEEHDIVSNGSCTTNSMTALVHELHRRYGIEKGMFSTVHSVTGDQKILDAAHHKDFRRGRAAPFNIIPTSTGAAKSVIKLIPELEGKLHGIAYRVPTITGSVTDLNLELQQEVTRDEINAFVKELSQTHLHGIVDYTEAPLVSSDIVGNPHSGIVDGISTEVTAGNLLKLVVWYDNEWGFSNRMVEVMKLIMR